MSSMQPFDLFTEPLCFSLTFIISVYNCLKFTQFSTAFICCAFQHNIAIACIFIKAIFFKTCCQPITDCIDKVHRDTKNHFKAT